ncbi:hypothetical protein LOZ65_005300 [Ophidiomyces ophidiicola]|nr:hypothetical protein LOZ65_005300 [Ophidiomyces ophidiicola]
MAASLMGQVPHDAAPERSPFDLPAGCEDSKPPPSRDVTSKLEAPNDTTADRLQPASVSGYITVSDEYNKKSEREKQNAASSLLAQLLASKPLAKSPKNAPVSDQDDSLVNMQIDATFHDSLNPPTPSQNLETALENFSADQIALATATEASIAWGTNDIPKASDGEALQEEGSQEDSMEREHNLLLDAIQSSAKANPDLNPLYSDFTPIRAPSSAKEALLQNELFTNAYFGAVGGPTPRIVGYPELPSQKDAKGVLNDSESVSGSEPRIQAFAKLEFDDGHFYVNTYSFILGRDVRAARAAFQRDLQSKNQIKHAGNGIHTPSRPKTDGNHTIMGSVISDTGGIMGFDPDVPQHCPPQMSWKSSNSSNGHHNHPILHMSQAEPDMTAPVEPPKVMKDYNALAMDSMQNGRQPRRVDTLSLLPTPDSCPIIPIHPPSSNNGAPSSHRGISRKHVKIAYNFNRNVFEMEVMGRNGAFIGADWLAPGQIRPLHSGDFIQIGGVRVRFLLPDVPIGETGSEMIESPLLEPKDEDLPLPDEADEKLESEADHVENSDGEDLDGNEAEKTKVKKLTVTVSESRMSVEDNASSSQPNRRRGPGRPPKDGIMSKRERAEIAREQKLAARREANGGVTPPPSLNKAKLSKSGKEAAPEEPPTMKQEKRKYTKRKKPDSAPGDSVVQSIECANGNVETAQDEPVKPTPVKKRKPSRSPSPDYPPESFYTPKELSKPPYNYAVLIHDALSDSPTPMTLKQIYRALKLKYPYFRFRCETEGWTSSVRHNLNGNTHLFMHAERDGKGWSWKLIPGASVDKEKKRRPSPPPQDISHLNNQHFIQPTAPPYNVPHPISTQHPPPHYTYQAAPQQAPMAPPPPPPPVPARRINSFPFLSSHLPQNTSLNDLPIPFSFLSSPTYRSPYSTTPPPLHFPYPRYRRPLPQPPLPPPPPQRRQPPPSPVPPPPPSQTYNAPSIIKFQTQPYTPTPHPTQTPIPPTPPPPPQIPVTPPVQAATSGSSLSLKEDPAFLARANQAIDNFEAVLMEDYEDQEYIKNVLRSARNRVLNGAKESSFPGGEPKDEAVIIDALKGIIGQLTEGQGQSGIG